jgi:hypothetical protein
MIEFFPLKLKDSFILMMSKIGRYYGLMRNWDTSTNIVRGYKFNSHKLTPGRSNRFFSSLLHPDWLWGPPSFLSNVYHTSFPPRYSEADHSALSMAKARMAELYI